MDQKFKTNRKPIQEMDTGKKKMLDGSLPSPQMKKLQTLSIRKLFSHYLPRMVLQYSQNLKSHTFSRIVMKKLQRSQT